MSTETLPVGDFYARCKALLDDPAQCKCTACPDGGQLLVQYGLAGGGLGPYLLCMGCGAIPLKGIEPGGDGECFHHE